MYKGPNNKTPNIPLEGLSSGLYFRAYIGPFIHGRDLSRQNVGGYQQSCFAGALCVCGLLGPYLKPEIDRFHGRLDIQAAASAQGPGSGKLFQM